MKILIIEDETILLKNLVETFVQENFTVESASDGQAGLTKALSWQPDIILLDLLLPVMTGDIMLEQLRKDGWGKTVPVIILTNNSSTSSIADMLAKGSYRYLLKTDVQLDELVLNVRETVGKNKDLAQSVA